MFEGTKQTAGQKAVIVGAGIVGLTSALAMAKAGYSVTIVERADRVCFGSSKANAGQLLYDRIGAMGSPGFLRGVSKSAFDPQQGISITGLAHPKRWPWGAAFLRQCTVSKWQENTRGLLEIAAVSRSAMRDLQALYALDFDWRRPGKLVVYSTPEVLEAAAASMTFQAQFGGTHRVVNREECLELEPALRNGTRPIAGGIYLPDAEVADCQKFGQEISRLLREHFLVDIQYATEAQGFTKNGDHVTGLRTNQGLIDADIVVLATGKSVHDLLPKMHAFTKPLVGVKGMSLTFPAGDAAPDLSVTDALGKFVVLRLGDRVRIAGNALFEDGEDIKPWRVAQLIKNARGLMPMAVDYTAKPDVWVGIRPQMANDLPMIGPTRDANVFTNAGHGSLGFTLALGSAEILTRQITTARV